MEHKVWRGKGYDGEGIRGSRVCIVGYSHWLGAGKEADDADTTTDVVAKVVSGEYRIAFFTQIRNYFGFKEHADFWRRVVFFNYLPNAVGGADARYHSATDVEPANKRFEKVLAKEQPDKVAVFTMKGWRGLAPVLALSPCGRVLSLGLKLCELRRYDVGKKCVPVLGLRHPQGAPGELMRQAVQWMLDIPSL